MKGKYAEPERTLPWLSTTRRGPSPITADAETREDATQQVVGGECAGDFAQVLLGLAQILGQQFAGAIVDKLAVAMLQRLPCQA